MEWWKTENLQDWNQLLLHKLSYAESKSRLTMFINGLIALLYHWWPVCSGWFHRFSCYIWYFLYFIQRFLIQTFLSNFSVIVGCSLCTPSACHIHTGKHFLNNSVNIKVTDVFVSLDVLQHRPLLVIPVIPSLSVDLKLLDSGGGGSAWADPVHGGRDSLAEARLDGPYLTEDLEQYGLHALVYAALRRCLWLRLGGAAVSHWATADGWTGGEEPASWQVGAAAGALWADQALSAPHTTTRTSQQQLAHNLATPATLRDLTKERHPSTLVDSFLTEAVEMTSRINWLKVS